MSIILGGTHGLGAQIAAVLRQTNQDVLVTGRSYDPANHGDGAKVDLTDEQSVAALQQQLTPKVAAADSINLFWCAGMGYKGDFAAQTTVQQMVALNVAGPLPLVQWLWQQMLHKKGPSHLVVISSTTGVKARADEAVYAATKHAQVGFTRSLGMESERLGAQVKVALFLPGGMQTDFWDDTGKPDAYPDYLDPEKVAARIVERTKMQDAAYYEETIERGSL
jgi:short-subunit dehydrogenase